MKNIFKLMGIALLAGAMLFTACKKEEEEVTPAITVSFDNDTWTSDVAMELSSTTPAYFDVYKTGADMASMQFCCPLANGTYVFAGTEYYVKYWDDNDVEYDTPSNESNITVTDVQLDARTMSAEITANLVHDGNHPLTATLVNAKWND